ncbi:hypothetical protein GCM10029964_029010 [Kibdelosporangium lantanae]
MTTAIAESTLHNYTESDDYDSLGLFQQRPSQGWGTPAEITDPAHATNSFVNAMVDKYPDNSWMSGDIGVICQKVQVSAYPDAYDAEAPDAGMIVNALWAPATSHVMSGDVDGDGHADLVAVTTDGRLNVYRATGGSGTQTWSAASYAGYGWQQYRDVLLADVDGDHRAELIGVDNDGKMYVYHNKGGGGTQTWEGAVYAGYGWDFAHILAADVDGDGHADLVAVRADGNMYVYRNKGGGGTGTRDAPVFAGYGWQSFQQILLSDVTADGRADLVTTDADGKIYVYTNKGGTGTQTWNPAVYAGYGWHFPGLTAADVTADHRAELIAIDGDGRLDVYPNAGGRGTQTWGAPYYAGNGWNAYLY